MKMQTGEQRGSTIRTQVSTAKLSFY